MILLVDRNVAGDQNGIESNLILQRSLYIHIGNSRDVVRVVLYYNIITTELFSNYPTIDSLAGDAVKTDQTYTQIRR